MASLLISGIALVFTLGSLFSGRYVNKFGRRRLTVFSTFLLGLFTISYTIVPIFLLSFVIVCIGSFIGGVRVTASSSLTLEQVPEYRGTMMSINSAAYSLGGTLGSTVGGIILTFFGWEMLGLILGIFAIIASIIFYFLVIDTTIP